LDLAWVAAPDFRSLASRVARAHAGRRPVRPREEFADTGPKANVAPARQNNRGGTQAERPSSDALLCVYTALVASTLDASR